MGKMIDGQWTTQWYGADAQGRFQREETLFRQRITLDGSTPFAPGKGRYHLYVSLACPWAHRTLIARRLKRLDEVISLSVVDWHMGDEGWRFGHAPGATDDAIGGATYLRDVYRAARADYTGRVTVPILWDRETATIVNNESRDIMEMFDDAFDAWGDPTVRLFPGELRADIDATVDAIYDPINNGVYRAGFATSQLAYDEAVAALFAALDHWDQVLGGRRYLLGDDITAADWCLFTTLIRFDAVYYTHFKCNLRHIYEYANLGPYLRELYRQPGVAETCNFEHIKGHYFTSHPTLNPSGIIPAGPVLDFIAMTD